MHDAEELHESLDKLSRLLISEHTLDQLLQQVVSLAASAVAGCDTVEVLVVEDRKVVGHAYSHDLMAEVHKALRPRDGTPYLEAIRAKRALVIPAMAEEARWARFCSVAAERGLTSGLFVPLVAGGRAVGALNGYARVPGAIREASEELGMLIAAHAAVVIANLRVFTECLREVEQLNEAVRSRTVVERARGILMERTGSGAEEAFAMMRVASQNRHEKLRNVAERIIASATPDGSGPEK